MRDQSLIHDVALMTSREIMGIFELLIENDEHDNVLAVVMHVVVAGIESYDMMAAPRIRRLNPGDN